MIVGVVSGQELKLSTSKIVADTLDYQTARFTFSSADWDGIEKWAHFARNGVVYDILLTDDCICKTDHLNLSEGTWQVYIHGNRFADKQVIERITTDVARMYVNPTGMLDGEPLPDVPATEAELLRAEMADLREAATELAGESEKSAVRSEIAAKRAENSANTAESANKDAQSAAESASSAATSAAASADRAEQVAVKNGYVEFELSNEDGILYLYRTDNIVDEIDFILDENTGELEVEIA